MKTLEQKAEEIAQSIVDQNPSFKDAFHYLVSTYIRGWNECENAMRIKAEKAFEEKAENYANGRAMAMSFKPLAIEDVKEAYLMGAEEMKRNITR